MEHHQTRVYLLKVSYKPRVLVCSGFYNKIPLTGWLIRTEISHSSRAWKSRIRVCQLGQVPVKALYRFAVTLDILISRINMVNYINVKEYYKVAFFFHRFLSSFYLPDIYFLPSCHLFSSCETVTLYLLVYHAHLCIFNYSVSFYFRQISCNQHLSRFCFFRQSGKDLVLFLFLYLYIKLQLYILLPLIFLSLQ